MKKQVVKQTWRQLIEFLPDAVLCTDDSGQVTAVNKAVSDLLGFSRLELLSLNINEILPECGECTKASSRDGVCFFRPGITADSWNSACEVNLRHRNGEMIPVLLSANRVELFGNEVEGFNFAIIKDVRPLQASRAKLDAEKKRFELLFNNINDAVFLSPITKEGVHGDFVEVNDVACERLGYTRDELLSLNARTINPQANFTRVKSFGRNIKREGKTEFEAIHVAKDGTQIPVGVAAKVISIDDQDYVLSITRDLREQKELVRSQERFGQLMEHSWDEIYVFDSESLLFLQVNQGARDNLGYSNQELLGLSVVDIKTEMTEDDFRKLVQPLFEGKESRLIFETTHQRKDGSTYPVEVRLQMSHNEVPPVFLANVQDIAERRKSEQRLQYLANYDSLTGLPNRSLFMDRLKMAIENGKRSGYLNAVMFLDLDGFKGINDTLGHDAGDLYIKEIGRRLVESVRKSDTVARMGGDEFTIILTNLSSVEGAEVVAKKIITDVSAPYMIYEKEVQATISIGITMFPFAESDDASTLIKQADTAMYNAKSAGKNNYQFFTSRLAESEICRVRIEQALRHALVNDEFQLFYQPRIDFESDRIVGVEALLRWTNHELGSIGPDKFIPVLESTGKIKEVGHWVLKQACQQLVAWRKEGIQLRVSVNVSARQFEDGLFFFQLEEALETWDVPPDLLEIEITEGMLLHNDNHVQIALEKIKKLGVSVSLDDFGTGYSALSYLKQYPIDILKIDRSFIRDLDEQGDSGAIVEAIINMAKSLNMRVTAEGIEDERHAVFLRERNCEEGQGYLYGKPMPAGEIAELICASSANNIIRVVKK